MSELILKPMETEEEIRGKAFVHWKSWQESYPGIVDAGYLAGLTLEKCEALARAYPDNTWVAYALYVLEAFQKQKIGWRLMRFCLEELAGCGRVFVWVLAGNDKAIRFYEQVGFRPDGNEKMLTLGAPVKVIRMVLEPEGAQNGR